MKRFKSILPLLLVLFALWEVPVFSQVPINFGLKGGLNLSNIIADDIDSDFKVGFVGGVFVRIRLAGIDLQPEVLYTMKGYKAESLDGRSISLDYVEIPVLLKYYFQSSGDIDRHIFFGPAVAFRTRAKSGDDEIPRDQVEKSTTSLVIGGGIDINMSPGAIELEIRYTHGISDTFNETHSLVASGGRNAVISLLVGYSF